MDAAEAQMAEGNAVARQVGEAMFARDAVSRRLGIALETVTPGRARMNMAVDEAMINGHGVCSGGYLFILADAACAYACNSYNANTISQTMDITFVAVARLGQRLFADASEVSFAGRSGIYDIRIEDEGGRVMALARGHCRILKGKIVEDLPATRVPG